jgi:ectoine hydroxylase-related dioxygenase (phytanoyl-CoA dioxygenase family)
MSNHDELQAKFQIQGYDIQHSACAVDILKNIQNELLELGRIIETKKRFNDINSLWNWLKVNDRTKGGDLYNAFKFLPSVAKLASSDFISSSLRDVCGINFPALIDINCRIDSKGEEKFLFDWHQDYWFSICSTQSVVVWIPVTALTPELGGLDLISNEHTGGRIFNTKKGELYKTYADAVLLDEDIPADKLTTINKLNLGDFLLFRFNTLHKSNVISSSVSSRFTIQLRFSDLNDSEFIQNRYKPGMVTPTKIDYIERGKQSEHLGSDEV